MNKLWLIRNLKKLGATEKQLLDIFYKHCRSILEYCVPVLNSGLTKNEENRIERVQKIGFSIIKGRFFYDGYKGAVADFKAKTLKERRRIICEKFSVRAYNDKQFNQWFQYYTHNDRVTRTEKPVLKPVPFRTRKFQKSPLAQMTEFLNNKFKS